MNYTENCTKLWNKIKYYTFMHGKYELLMWMQLLSLSSLMPITKATQIINSIWYSRELGDIDLFTFFECWNIVS